MDFVLAWLATENARAGGFAEGLLDLGTVGVAGHSRGGKLAALHLVGASSHSLALPSHHDADCSVH